MTTIELFADDQNLRAIESPKLASGDKNSVKIHVEFNSEWDGYIKTGVFFVDILVYLAILFIQPKYFIIELHFRISFFCHIITTFTYIISKSKQNVKSFLLDSALLNADQTISFQRGYCHKSLYNSWDIPIVVEAELIVPADCAILSIVTLW